LILCVDFGSTFTKAALVDELTGKLLGVASHRTTIPGPDGRGDVLDGLDACRAELARSHPGFEGAEVLACSSAGGGLRIAVVGNEELVTAEAGRRVALSSGGKVVAVLSRVHDDAPYRALGHTTCPDVVLLTSAAQAEVVALLGDLPVVVTDNVVPRIGVLAPEPARRAIREMFLAHVIGGKQLSRRADFTTMVRGATPDLVLTGVEMLAAETGGNGVVVVDIGGATTDVHSVVRLDPEEAELSREVVASTPVNRTVEGDLGMRWSALSTWEAGRDAGLVGEDLRGPAVRRAAEPSFLPETDVEREEDEQIAAAAATLALRRHVGRSRVVVGPEGRVVERTGKDLREVDLLVGSGGVLRHATPAGVRRMLTDLTGVSPAGWQQPEHPRIVVDRDYVLAAVGLLTERRPAAAAVLARSLSTCEETCDS